MCSYTRTTYCTGYPEAGAAAPGPRRSGLPGGSKSPDHVPLSTPTSRPEEGAKEAGYPTTAPHTRTTLIAGYPEVGTDGPADARGTSEATRMRFVILAHNAAHRPLWAAVYGHTRTTLMRVTRRRMQAHPDHA